MHSETQLESFNSETELLRTAPPSPSLPHSKLTEDTTAWRLDSSIGTGVPDGRGPLMDSSGRVCLLLELHRVIAFITL